MSAIAESCRIFPLTILITLIFIVGNIECFPQRQRESYNFEGNNIEPRPQEHLDKRILPSGGRVIQKYDEQLQNIDQYETPNYDFKYQIHGGGNYFGHEESRRDYKAQGKYHVLLPDGRRQVVSYYADETGYHPTITYEQVGVPNLQAKDISPSGYDEYNHKPVKRNRFYRHSKRVHLEHPLKFKTPE